VSPASPKTDEAPPEPGEDTTEEMVSTTTPPDLRVVDGGAGVVLPLATPEWTPDSQLIREAEARDRRVAKIAGVKRVIDFDRIPPAPLHVMPKVVREYAEALAVDHCVDPAMPMQLILGALSGVFGRRAMLCVKPGWYATCCIWAAVVTDASGGKTPPLKRIAAPLFQQDEWLERQYNQAMADWHTACKQEPDPAKRPEEPVCERAVASDTTIEALTGTLMASPKGVALIHDELSGLILGMNQYRGGHGSDRQKYLSMWSGAPLLVDRKMDRKRLRVPHPFVAMIGGIQWDKVNVLMKSDEDDGLLGRILFATPRPVLTGDEVSSPPVPREIEDRYRAFVEAALELPRPDESVGVPGDPGPWVVEMAGEAQDRFRACYTAHAEAARRASFPEVMKPAWRKLGEYAARLTLLMHLIRRAAGETSSDSGIDVESVEAAWALVRWYAAGARAVREVLDETAEDIVADAMVAWLRRQGPDAVSLRTVIRCKAAGCTKQSDALAVLGYLRDRGMVSQESKRRAGGITHLFTLRAEYRGAAAA